MKLKNGKNSLIIAFLIVLFTANIVHAKGDIFIFSSKNDTGKKISVDIEKSFAKNGFTISGNTDLSGAFEKIFNQSDFSVFNLLSVIPNKLSEKLVEKYPNAGIFVPSSVAIYQLKGDKNIQVATLSAEAKAKILGLKDIDPLLIEIEKQTVKSIKSALPNMINQKSNDPAIGTKKALLSLYELEVDNEDWGDSLEELEMSLEDGFGPLGFIMSNFTDYSETLSANEDFKSMFDFYHTYSICKIKVVYSVSKSHPEAGAFAPCSLMVYKMKDDPKIVIGFPSVYNWLSSVGVNDKESVDFLMKAQSDFEKLLGDLTEE